jgi:L-fuculose-phosphate aldolase
MDTQIQATRAKIAYVGALLFQRQLTDISGGNISARVGDLICITPRYSGSKFQWQLRPEQVLVVDKTGQTLDGDGVISREANVHLKLLNEFADGTAVIHAHSRNILVFAALNRSMPPVLEATLKFGEIKSVGFAPAHSPQLAENVAGGIRGQEARIRKHAAAVIASWHGLFLIGKDLDAALDAVERLDLNARCIILGQIMKLAGMDDLASERAALQAAAAAMGKEL